MWHVLGGKIEFGGFPGGPFSRRISNYCRAKPFLIKYSCQSLRFPIGHPVPPTGVFGQLLVCVVSDMSCSRTSDFPRSRRGADLRFDFRPSAVMLSFHMAHSLHWESAASASKQKGEVYRTSSKEMGWSVNLGMWRLTENMRESEQERLGLYAALNQFGSDLVASGSSPDKKA